MAFEITKIEVWAGEIQDRPGALAEALEAVQRVGANLDFIVVRPSEEKPGQGVVFLSPLFGADQINAATHAGLSRSRIHALRLLGPDRPGLAAGVCRTLADAGINITGMTGAVIGERAILYLRFESDAELVSAARILTAKLV